VNLSVISAGGVTPAGVGAAAVSDPWPLVTTRSEAGHPVRAGLVDRNAAALVAWQKEPRLRRASPIAYFMVEAVDQVLQAAPGTDRGRTGVIACFFLGCLVYSVRFYRQITDEGRRFASPVLFPETVFNSPLSHVVATLGLGGPVYSQIGDKSCWAAALRTAQCWLANGDCDNVVVLGAEEFEPHEVDALRAGGLLRGGLHPCEGAVALLVSAARGGGPTIGRIADGFSFARKKDAVAAARNCLENFPATLPLLDTATAWTREAAGALERPMVGGASGSPEGFTMSAAADTWRAVALARSGKPSDLLVPVWGLTRSFAAYRVTA
jgi:hypothetical protein